MESFREYFQENRKALIADWLLLLVTMIIYALTEYVMNPVVRIFYTDDQSIGYPYTEQETVPTYALLLIAIALPLVCILIVSFLQPRIRRDPYFAIMGLIICVLLTGVITNIIKNSGGRLRPDFLARCQWNGTDCTGDPKVIKDGRKSFPSGHASMSAAGLAYLAFYFGGKMMMFDGHGRYWKVAIFFVPMLGAILVALSRVSDYRHHPTDVLAGWLLGLFFAYFTYRQYYPPLNSSDPGIPLIWKYDHLEKIPVAKQNP
jgi:diacylglycerol diphosphate phosphatase/phosphatidate phosphatase